MFLSAFVCIDTDKTNTEPRRSPKIYVNCACATFLGFLILSPKDVYDYRRFSTQFYNTQGIIVQILHFIHLYNSVSSHNSLRKNISMTFRLAELYSRMHDLAHLSLPQTQFLLISSHVTHVTHVTLDSKVYPIHFRLSSPLGIRMGATVSYELTDQQVFYFL